MKLKPPKLRAIYHMRFLPGVLVGSTLLLVALWYAWAAWAAMDRARRYSRDKSDSSLEMFHLALYDELTRDLRRMLLPERPAASALPTLDIAMSRPNYDALIATRGQGADGYVDATLRASGTDSTPMPARIRLRGGQSWHVLGAQKSMKVRMERGDLLWGTRVFNLINEPTPFGLESKIILDIAREEQLLTPEYFPVRVRLNNADMGVYFYEAQPDEGLLRRNHRMPGSMYSGESETTPQSEDQKTGGLFWEPQSWSKVAWANDASRTDTHELTELLQAVTRATPAEFAAYAAAHIDLDKYALFDALDVVFGGNDHDYLANHKLYYDPYLEKFEPVAWSYRAFDHEERMNLVDNPLLIRLKMLPGYLAKRNAWVYSLLSGKASVPSIKERAQADFAALAPDLKSDPFWDAYKLLPRVTRYFRFLARPMNERKWALATQDELVGYVRRSRFLFDRLESANIQVFGTRTAPRLAELRMKVSGEGSFRLEKIVVKAPCSAAFSLTASGTAVAAGTAGTPTAVTAHTLLEAGVTLVPRSDPHAKRGNVWAETIPRDYTYILTTASCAATEVEFLLQNLVTQDRQRITHVLPRQLDKPSPPLNPAPGMPPTFSAGETSLHPWQLAPEPTPALTTWGPGRITLDSSRTFGATETLTVNPGTEIAMDNAVTLTVLGRAQFLGTEAHPIRIVPLAANTRVGGLVLKGRGATGSALEYIEASAAISVIGADNVSISHVTLHNLLDTEDALHATYAEGLTLEAVTVTRPPVDGIDLEHSSVQASHLRVIGAGDDCLDLMGTTLRLRDSALVACSNNAVSAGEESHVVGQNLFVAGSKQAVLAKNASSVRVTRSAIYRSATALETHKKELYYEGNSSIFADELVVVDCERLANRAGSSKNGTIDAGQPQLAFSDDTHQVLRTQVLGILRWSELDALLRSWGVEELAP